MADIPNQHGRGGAGSAAVPADSPPDEKAAPRSLRIVAADRDPALGWFYQQTLGRLGHQIAVAATGRQLVELCRLVHPDLVIAEVEAPDLDGAAAAEVGRDRPTPIILVSGNDPTGLVRRVLDDPCVMAYLFKPLTEAGLKRAIVVAMSLFEQFSSLHQEVADLRQALEDRKILERAKGTIMKYAGMDETEAYRRLKKLASVEDRKLVEVAQAVLTAGEVFQHLDQLPVDTKPPLHQPRGAPPRRKNAP